ncbi:MAG: hypothetical protein IPK64_19620 [bacterium]|nr:hypothetical protein [bacterium]
MTKSKPKPVKPVLGWCVLGDKGDIRQRRCFRIRNTAVLWSGDNMIDNPRIIRVEIRPAPKRRKGTHRG